MNSKNKKMEMEFFITDDVFLSQCSRHNINYHIEFYKYKHENFIYKNKLIIKFKCNKNIIKNYINVCEYHNKNRIIIRAERSNHDYLEFKKSTVEAECEYDSDNILVATLHVKDIAKSYII